MLADQKIWQDLVSRFGGKNIINNIFGKPSKGYVEIPRKGNLRLIAGLKQKTSLDVRDCGPVSKVYYLGGE
jgi:hypothetical protein